MLSVSWAQTLPPPTADPEGVRRGADEILARPEFQEPARSLYQRALDWIGDRLADAIGALIAGGSTGVIAWVFLALVVALVVWLVMRAVQRDAGRRGNRGGPALGVEVERDERRPATAWLAEAERLEGEGRWREAVRCRYRALVATLAGRGVVEEVPGRTAGEYRTLVRAARPPVAEPFADASDLFEEAWYGPGDTGPEAGAAFRRLADRVTSE